MSGQLGLFEVGATFSASLTMSASVIETFRELSADHNAIHCESAYARRHGFREPIAYGNLLGVLLSKLVGMHLPTGEVIILRESIDFKNPVYKGDEVELRATVASIHEAVSSVQLKLNFTVGEGQVATGLCVIKCL
jgi:acyl dehydratase